MVANWPCGTWFLRNDDGDDDKEIYSLKIFAQEQNYAALW
jgi:hypothetical protein